jgi:hypothetical protein
MLPLVLVAVGAYLIGDSVLGDKKYAKGGKLGKSFMMGDEEVYIKDSSIGLDDEVCLFYKKDDSILKCISKNQFDKFVEQGKLVPKMAKGGKVRSQKEFNELVAEKEKIVKNLSPKEISEMWNKNSNSPSKMTEDEAKTSTSKMYLRDLLVEKELTKAEHNKYFAKGGKLVGKQKNLDVNKNGKLDTEDFKMLRGEKMADGGETKMPYKEFEETLREYEIEGGFGKIKEKGYEMYYLPNGNPYLNTKFKHRNKKKAYQQYVKMDK